MRTAWSRYASGCAAIAALAGGAAVVTSLATLPHPWIGGYVSEAGVTTNPRAWLYQAGLVGLAVALVLLGTVLSGIVWIAGVLMICAGILGSVSAAVSCSAGCPLPPYQHATLMDLIHAGASSAAVGLIALAMAVITMLVPDEHEWLRRTAQVGFAVVAPLLVALGIGLLAIGHRAVTAALERAVLVAVFTWLVITAAQLVRRARSG